MKLSPTALLEHSRSAEGRKQIRYADRRGIPFVWFPADPADPAATHSVKDIRSGEQVTADPAGWAPPEADLRPFVRRTVIDPTKEQHL